MRHDSRVSRSQDERRKEGKKRSRRTNDQRSFDQKQEQPLPVSASASGPSSYSYHHPIRIAGDDLPPVSSYSTECVRD